MTERFEAREILCIHGNAGRCLFCASTDGAIVKHPADARTLFEEQSGALTAEEKRILMPFRRGSFSEYVAGAGIYDTGSFLEVQKEKESTGKLLALMREKEIDVGIISADDLLSDASESSLVVRLLDLGRELGVRTSEGLPRGVIITGFSQSQYLTVDALRQLRDWGITRDPRLNDYRARAQRMMMSSVKKQVFEEISDDERGLVAGAVLAERYIPADWQRLSGRKNGLREETLINITVAPHEVFEMLFALETGTVHPVGGQSRMLFRWQEFMSNYPI